MGERPRVVVVGGGFAGLHAARHLGSAPVATTLVDRRNFHLFQPLLYQVATGGLSPANIAAPLRHVLRRQRGTRVLMAEATDFDLEGRRVLLGRGHLDYDYLIVAAGAENHHFGRSGWADLAPGLKSLEDALEMRRRIFRAFEAAEAAEDPAEAAALLTIVVVGGGPTGVELAGTLAEIARDTLRCDFRRIDTARARILLLEGSDRILPPYHPRSSARAARDLARLGVEVRTGTTVAEIAPAGVRVEPGGEWIPARTVLWGAGVRASPLAGLLAAAAGVETDRQGRVPVGPGLELPGHPEAMVLGDMAAALDRRTGEPLPAVAPVAAQQGKYAANRIKALVRSRPARPFRYRDYGTMAAIGRHAAVAEIGRLRLYGIAGWLAWLFIHLMKMVEHQNRVLVLVQWAWSYLTYQRSARLITWPRPGPCGPDRGRGPPPPPGPGPGPISPLVRRELHS